MTMKNELPMVRAMPFYLVIQATLMFTAFLDFPAYMLAFRAGNTALVTPWVVMLIFLIIIGLVFGISALALRSWRQNLDAAQRLKLVGGYFLGALAGFVAFGLRLMQVMPNAYFYFVGALTLLLILAFIVFRVQSARKEELFP
jgi:hypothetical protein